MSKLNKINFKSFPSFSGVYLMKDINDIVIYVGKAKNLKNRIKSYFSSDLQNIKTNILVENIYDIDFIITNNELEAFILENNLIKKYQPKYNILLKDDKTYPFIKVTVNELYPRVFKTRKIKRDGARYFGPYVSSRLIKVNLEIIESLFPIRTCDLTLPSIKILEPCLDYHIKKCDGCCIGKITGEQYNTYIDKVLLLLSGKYKKLIEELVFRMKEFSDKLDFDKAIIVRDQIKAIKKLNEKQIVYSTEDLDIDMLGYVFKEDVIVFILLIVREGKLLDKKQFIFYKKDFISDFTVSNLIKKILIQFYSDFNNIIPREVVIDEVIDEIDQIKSYIKKERNEDIKITFAKTQKKKDWISLAVSNANITYLNIKNLVNNNNILANEQILLELQQLLNLKIKPRVIEAFDISNTLGRQSVASMISFINGKPKKANYRYFKIKSVKGPNDVESIKEAVGRRYQKLKNEELTFPDLILIDGGKGQVNGAFKVLKALGVDVEIIGLAKKLEEVFFPNNSIPIKLSHHSQALRLLQRVRDESHRFANNFHRKLRSKDMLKSKLMDLPNVGVVRYNALMKYFKTLENLKNASFDDILSVDKMNRVVALTVFEFFRDLD